ncbi:hypothetical protein PQX77_012210 [Marasmius sp. AFHP31]|nr:hypothetical protein PQX77_012210 [Marasmius sp. AFHP31]
MTGGDQELILPDSEKDILDSVTTVKFKKTTGKENLNDNVRKLLENATHKMFSDPRRRFHSGITIEDTQMRFWYLSQLHHSTMTFLPIENVSYSPFQNPKPFIHFLLAISSFATPAELGYDPTVVRLNVDGEWVYDYYVEHPKDRTQWHRTIESLDTHRAARFPGRGVRVWVVKLLDRNRRPYPPGSAEDKRYVLKDYWFAMDSDSESKILGAIVTAAMGRLGQIFGSI